MADPPPQCLVWLPLMHRLANVENGKTIPQDFSSGHAHDSFTNIITTYFFISFFCLFTSIFLLLFYFLHQVFHPVECSYCRSESMMGFRYRCQQCHGYQLCQSCFWRGHANGPHSNQHQMKEHSSWVCLAARSAYTNTATHVCMCVCEREREREREREGVTVSMYRHAS